MGATSLTLEAFTCWEFDVLHKLFKTTHFLRQSQVLKIPGQAS